MKKLIIILVLILLVAVTGGAILLVTNPDGIFDTYPEICVINEITETADVPIDFVFEGRIVSGKVELNLAPYFGAQSAVKTAHLYGDSTKTDWQEKYYLAITTDPALDDMYNRLTAFFREYAEVYKLDDNEYVELVTAYVQSIPYKTAGMNTKFPIETVIENEGDCDDKSTLLAGLLARAGYDAALFSYENHMTAGIKADGRYIPIETTAKMYPGEVADVLDATLSDVLAVYKIGEGTKTYTAYNQVQKIMAAKMMLADRISEIKSLMKTMEEEMDAQLSEIEANYTAAGERRYNANVNKYNEFVEMVNRDAVLLNELYNGTQNRKGMYEKIKDL